MIEDVFRSARSTRRLRSCLLAPDFEDLVAYLVKRGYPAQTIRRYVVALEHFDSWLRRTRRTVSSVDETVVVCFLRGHLPRCRCQPPCNRTVQEVRAALGHLLTVLRSTGRVSAAEVPMPTPGEALVRGFEAHLRDERGAAEVTCNYSARYAREFIDDQFRGREVNFSRVGPMAITRFLAARAGRWTPASMKVAAVSLRRFLRYLQFIGRIDGRLAQSVPAIAGWKLASIPRGLTDQQVAGVLAAFDRATPIGLRGYATTMCLVGLGLRPCEVAALTLDDIDWRTGVVTVPATKTRRADVLPLPALVARAILAYLRRGRPSATTRQLFVRHGTPAGVHAGAGHIRVAVKAAGVRAGLAVGCVNANLIRHTVATRLIRSGATMKDVADVLRHRSIDTAAIYAKVDIDALRDVAAPWPRRTP
jgi:integrase/recombinase XerD